MPSRKRRRVMEFLMDVPYISQVSVKSTYYIFHAYNSASHYICSMFLNRCTLTALLLAFLVPTVHAQQRPYSIVHYTTDHGLPQNSITGIAFDRWGYCWLGTEMGLVRFDGKSFTVFSTYNVPGLRAERIRILTTDSAGTVYAQNELRQNLVVKTPGPYEAPRPELVPPDQPLWVVYGHVTENPTMVQYLADRRHVAHIHNFPNGDSYHVEHGKLQYVHNNRMYTLYSRQNNEPMRGAAVGNAFMLIDYNGKIKVWENGKQLTNIATIDGPLHQNKSWLSGRNYLPDCIAKLCARPCNEAS